jgi:hypothetical protein
MKALRLVLAPIMILALVACGGSPNPPSGGKPGRIDISVSGAINGHATQLDLNQGTQGAECITPDFARKMEQSQTTLFPVINGKTYDFTVAVARFKGPVTVTLPDPSHNVVFSLEDLSNRKDTFVAIEKAMGTFVMNADVNSGHLNVKRMTAADLEDSRTIDMTATWSCTPKQ